MSLNLFGLPAGMQPTLGQGVSMGASGVSDIFQGFGDFEKAQGELASQQAYEEAAGLATQNEKFTEQSTAIQTAQQQRQLYGVLGQQQSQIAGAGFGASGSALDILHESASQGALQRAVLSEQGLITEAGYKEQAASYTAMANAAGDAASADKLAGYGAIGAGALNMLGGLAAL